MGSRAIYWIIVVVVLAIAGFAFWAKGYPARVTVINNSGTEIDNVTIESGGQQVVVPLIANGSASSVTLDSGRQVTIRTPAIHWTSTEKLSATRALVIYLFPDGRVEERSKVGTISP